MSCRAFAAAGARPHRIASRKIEACESAAEEVRGRGRRALALAVNASDWEQMDGLAEQAYAAFGRVDIHGQQCRRCSPGHALA